MLHPVFKQDEAFYRIHKLMRLYVFLLCVWMIHFCAWGQNDSVVRKPRQMECYKHSYLKESIAPVSLAAGSLIILAVPNLKESIQDKMNWNDDLKPGYINMGDDYIRYLPTAAVYLLSDVLADYGFRPKHNFFERTGLIAVSYVFNDFVVHNTKKLTKSSRPGRDPANQDYSFPSQHTAMAFVGATVLHKELGHISPWISVAGYAVASYVGYSRIARNRHWSSDVLMGAAIGILTTNITYWAYDGLKCLVIKKKELSVTPYMGIEDAGVYVTYNF